MTKKAKLLNHWQQLGVITRVEAKRFYDSLGGAKPEFTSLNVGRILDQHGHFTGFSAPTPAGRTSHVYVINSTNHRVSRRWRR